MCKIFLQINLYNALNLSLINAQGSLTFDQTRGIFQPIGKILLSLMLSLIILSCHIFYLYNFSPLFLKGKVIFLPSSSLINSRQSLFLSILDVHSIFSSILSLFSCPHPSNSRQGVPLFLAYHKQLEGVCSYTILGMPLHFGLVQQVE